MMHPSMVQRTVAPFGGGLVMGWKGRVNRHAAITEAVRNGKAIFVLIAEDNFLCKFFDNWAYQLAKNYAFNTVRGYCRDVCILINFIVEYSLRRGGLTPLVLSNCLDSFEDYLVFGVNSDQAIIRDVAAALGTSPVGGSTAHRYIVSANKFIDASEEFRLGMQELEKVGYVSHANISAFPQGLLFEGVAPSKIRNAIKENSWFAGCLAGGVKRIKYRNLVPKSKASQIAATDEFGGDDLAFPIDLMVNLIESATCARDAMLWSGCAAFGLRITEILSLTFSDIHASSGKVFIVDPRSRQDELATWLPAEEVKKLSHKGRTSTDTYGIEPFVSHFWYYYAQYYAEVRSYERRNPLDPKHNFVFRKLNSSEPLINSYQSVYERFRTASYAITGSYYGLHSMRHMYGYYLVNFCPSPSNPNRFGLDIRLVQKFMGHKSLKSTMRYARKDARMLEVTLSALNALRMGISQFSVSKVRLDHLNKLRSELSEILVECGDDKLDK